MLTEIRVYYEGDGLLKDGFSKFFAPLRDRARAVRCEFRLVSAGSSSAACRDFGMAMRRHRHAWNILLKDSDIPDTGSLSQALCREQGWSESHASSIFRMVEMMESWFYADKDAIATFYGSGFRRTALKPNPKVEEITKADLVKGLKAATKDTQKGDYFDNKTSHGPKLLAAISPEKVQQAAPNCQRLFDAVLAKLE